MNVRVIAISAAALICSAILLSRVLMDDEKPGLAHQNSAHMTDPTSVDATTPLASPTIEHRRLSNGPEMGLFSASLVSETDVTQLALGPLELRLESDGQNPRLITVMGTTWSGQLPGGTWNVVGAQFGQTEVRAALKEPLTPDNTHSVLVFLGFADQLVRARDAITGVSITEYAISTTGDSGQAMDKSPSYEETGAYTVHCSGITNVQLTAPGYLPTTIAINQYMRDVTAHMYPLCSLRVRLNVDEVSADKLPWRVAVSIRPLLEGSGNGHIREVAVKDLDLADTLLFTEVPAGPLDVRVSEVPASGLGVVLASRTIDVPPGDTTDVEIGLTSATDHARIDVVINGINPSVLDGDDVFVAILRCHDDGSREMCHMANVREMRAIEGTETAQRTIKGVAPGRYRITLHPFGLTEEIQAEPAGATNVTFELSDIIYYRIMPTGAESASCVRITWGYVDDMGAPAGLLVAANDTETKLGCSARPIWVQAVSDAGASNRQQISPTPGPSEVVELPVMDEQVTGIIIVPSPTGSIPPWDYWHVEASPVAHSGQHSFSIMVDAPKLVAFASTRPQLSQMVFSAPGSYDLRFRNAKREWVSKRVELRHGVVTVELDY